MGSIHGSYDYVYSVKSLDKIWEGLYINVKTYYTEMHHVLE